MSSRPSQVFLAVGTVAAGAYFLLPSVPQSFAYDVFGLACVGAIAVGVRRYRPAHPEAWFLFGGGLLLFVAGDLVLTYYDLVFHDQPFPSLADALYLIGYLFLVAGLMVLIRSRARGADRAAMIDALIIAVGLGVLAWAFWMVKYTADPTLSVPAVLISLAYPMMDIVMLGSVVRLALGPGEKAPAFYLLGLSLIALLAADVGFGLTTLAGAYQVGSPVDAGYTLSYVLWGAAALHPSMRLMSTPAPVREATLTGARLAALAGASLIGPVVMAVQSLRGGDVAVSVIVAASAVVFLLVLARMWGLMRLLADTAAKRALATQREQTLRRAAAWLVGAGDRETIHNAACDAVAAVTGGSAHSRVTVWAGSAEDATVVSSAGHRTPELSGARLELQALPASLQSALGAGEPIELPRIDGALSTALLLDASGGIGFVVPLLINGQLSGGFGVVTERPLSSEVKHSVLTLRDQVVLALESAALSEDLYRRQGEQRFAALVKQSSDVLTILGDNAVITYQTPSVQRVFGYRPDELTATSLLDLVHPDDRGLVLASLSHASGRPGVSPPVEWRTRHHNGSWRQSENVINNLRNDPNVGAIVINSRDVTERKQLEGQLVHQAFHDELTDLPNRVLFRDRAEHAVARVENIGYHAVLFLDLDDFKTINDSLGHAIGDLLLVEVAERLRRSCRRGDTASRLSGDEFAVLLEDIASPAEATRAAERIVAALREPFELDGREVFASASIGIAVKSGREEDAGEILRNADVAMYLAKSRGKARCEVFEPGMQTDALKRLELESDLRRAVENQELFLQYQPIVELESGTVTGIEALVRWRHPGRGIVEPLDFIASSEQTGLIVPIGRWVLQEACRQAQAWQRSYPSDPPLTINVNLSGRQLHDPDLQDDVVATLRDSGLAPQDLTLEITETVLMNDSDATIARLEELAALGVRLAIDDFGTGYSSLSYLRRFPVHVLKVAKPFVDDLAKDSDEAALANGIVQLGRTLHLQVIAEGIETRDQADLLRDMHCDMGQGFHFAKPMDPPALEQFLAQATLDQTETNRPARSTA
jgi:diguanylate cyclase (GGDEF)-like protein/PAS domain S-box-containing protein